MSSKAARVVTTLALIGLSTFGMAGTAMAVEDCDYPIPSTCLPATADKTEVGPGGEVSGDVGPVDDPVGEYIESTPVFLGTSGPPDAAGIVHYTVKIPANTAPGQHNLVFEGHNATGTVTFAVPITVTAAPGGGSGLPLTGGQIGAASVLAVGLLGAGTLTVVASRRRKATVSV
jgi:LPXTG-motif cell wall-anchored protein